ncbi:unnamed protein product, partial [marine sediment metagenome]
DYLHRVQGKGGKKLPLLMLLATEFQLPRRVYYLVERFAPTERDVQERIWQVANFSEKVELRKSVPVSDREPAMNLEPYEAYLRTLVGVARAHGFALVFMTQASSWNSAVDPEIAEWHWMLHRFGVTYREEVMDRAIEAYNDVMRRIAREFDVPLYDLARHLPKSSEYFYDDFHFNVGGAAAAGRALAAFLIERGQVPEQLPAPGR